ncbi:MAG: 50S ribosomal protein L30 [Ignavibacteria bacterium]|nr:50S ribosomal protein L30 [Ignavibacteria bacterium]MBT8383846.1 50S ribosomal protein L30 [Ignavibacteria bacterium]MBT8392072.1 50S ribosomal protein L30 [Ignavibacteria bacterium]NNJ54041.1 50S ribosomal protein L30 [Ignavibacteriaceae bacterium]NNL20999.1 50S ribosomal protein L30 [Ignavibacteriaceae bacterium]
MRKIKITQTRSIIDRPKDQKRTIEALGLGRPNRKKIHNDTPQIRGMIRKVSHLVKVEDVKDKGQD